MKKRFLFPCLLLVTSLVACGGGAAKGEEKNKSDFDVIAAQREKEKASEYTKATLKMKHYQKVEGRSGTLNYTVEYEKKDGEWSILSGGDELPSSHYGTFINFTMSYAEQFVLLLKGNLAPDAEPKYYVADAAATLEIAGTADTANAKGKVSASATWNKDGLLTKWHEKDNFTYYMGYNNCVIEETFNFTYSK